MKKFLIANPFGIGDALFSMACAQRIREVYPDAFIGFVCNERTVEFLKLCPALNRLHVFNRDHLRMLWKKSPLLYFKEIKRMSTAAAKEKYDTLIDFSLGREFSLAAMMIGVRRRIGFDYKGRGFFLTKKKKITSYADGPVAQAQLDLLWNAGVLPNNHMPARIMIEANGALPEMIARGSEPILAVAPGGGRSWGKDAHFKQWDVLKFVEVINSLSKSYPRVVLVGDDSERALLEQVQRGLLGTNCALMAGEPMSNVCAMLKRSSLLLCNDGGLMHLAHALGVKTVAIFGPVDEKVYGPYGGIAPAQVLTQDVPCRPCYRDFHFPPCAHSRRCLMDISVDKVIEVSKKVLAGTP